MQVIANQADPISLEASAKVKSQVYSDLAWGPVHLLFSAPPPLSELGPWAGFLGCTGAR